MNYQLSVTMQGDKFVTGIDEGAYQVSADTPLQALRKWIHYVGSQVVKYHAQEITIKAIGAKGKCI